jgi:hypothetical protein
VRPVQAFLIDGFSILKSIHAPRDVASGGQLQHRLIGGGVFEDGFKWALFSKSELWGTRHATAPDLTPASSPCGRCGGPDHAPVPRPKPLALAFQLGVVTANRHLYQTPPPPAFSILRPSSAPYAYQSPGHSHRPRRRLSPSMHSFIVSKGGVFGDGIQTRSYSLSQRGSETFPPWLLLRTWPSRNKPC